MNSLMDGIVDMHVHTMPDTTERNYNDFQLVEAANRVGARAVVLKCHHGSTVERAYLCNLYLHEKHPESKLQVFGSLVLNREVGGLNLAAVDYELSLGAKEIWLPTKDSRNDFARRGKVGGIAVLDQEGNVLPVLVDILRSIAAHGAVLATGHLSFAETCKVVAKAREVGVKNIVITHPEYWIVDETLEQQKYLVDKFGVVLEKVYIQPLKDGTWIDNMAKDLETIEKIGYQHIAMATDSGYYRNDPWDVMLEKYVDYLLAHGISEDEVRYMSRVNQKRLLGID